MHGIVHCHEDEERILASMDFIMDAASASDMPVLDWRPKAQRPALRGPKSSPHGACCKPLSQVSCDGKSCLARRAPRAVR